MTLTQNLDVTVLVAIITAFGIIATAIGVWLVPPLMEYLRRRREIKEKVRRLVLELECYHETEQEIERDLIGIGKGVVGPLKTGLKSTENQLTRRVIEKVLYKLGDKKARETLLTRFKGVMRSGKDFDEVRNTLGDIRELKIAELAPLLLKRLQEEKDDITACRIIETLGALGYKPALPHILQLANGRLGRSEDHISRACIMAIDEIVSKNLNLITAEELSRAASAYTTALRGEDQWSTGAVLRYLPVLLKRKGELRDPLKKELVEALVKLLNHDRSEIVSDAVQRLMQLGDKRAVPHLRGKLQEGGASSPIKPLLERALRVLEGRKF